MAFNVIHTPLKLIIHQQVLPLHFSRAEYLRILARRSHFGLILAYLYTLWVWRHPKQCGGIDSIMKKGNVFVFIRDISRTSPLGFVLGGRYWPIDRTFELAFRLSI